MAEKEKLNSSLNGLVYGVITVDDGAFCTSTQKRWYFVHTL